MCKSAPLLGHNLNGALPFTLSKGWRRGRKEVPPFAKPLPRTSAALSFEDDFHPTVHTFGLAVRCRHPRLLLTEDSLVYERR